MNEFKTIKSVSAPLDCGDLKAEIKKYTYALLIKTDSVSLIDTADDFNVDNLIEVRAFNDNSELHAILVNGAWRGRIRKDGEGNEVEIFDRNQLIWGKCVAPGKPSKLYEDRGITVMVPVEVAEDKRACLLIRSYLSDNEFEFVDYRICAIKEVSEVNNNE